MPCNPDNPKARNPNYECNPITNRWIKKKRIHKSLARNKTATKEKVVVVVKTKTATKEKAAVKTKTTTKEKANVKSKTGNCNPMNSRARDPRFKCNPITKRWVLVSGRIGRRVKQKTGCDPLSIHANDPTYECDKETNLWMSVDDIIKRDLVRSNPFLSNIQNIQNKTLNQVLTLIEENNGNRTKQKTKTSAQKQQHKQAWNKTCKEMEEKCPMETDLSGDNWCSLEPKDVFYYEKNGKRFCYGVDEIFSIIHLGFTARDTSYQIPPLRLQLPRDSYDRTPFTKSFFKAFKDHIKKHRQIPKQPEVCYFLKYYKFFYDNSYIQQIMNQVDPSKVQLSNAIDRFLMGQREIDINMNTSKWFWLAGKEPTNKFNYIFS